MKKQSPEPCLYIVIHIAAVNFITALMEVADLESGGKERSDLGE